MRQFMIILLQMHGGYEQYTVNISNTNMIISYEFQGCSKFDLNFPMREAKDMIIFREQLLLDFSYVNFFCKLLGYSHQSDKR